MSEARMSSGKDLLAALGAGATKPLVRFTQGDILKYRDGKIPAGVLKKLTRLGRIPADARYQVLSATHYDYSLRRLYTKEISDFFQEAYTTHATLEKA